MTDELPEIDPELATFIEAERLRPPLPSEVVERLLTGLALPSGPVAPGETSGALARMPARAWRLAVGSSLATYVLGGITGALVQAHVGARATAPVETRAPKVELSTPPAPLPEVEMQVPALKLGEPARRKRIPQSVPPPATQPDKQLERERTLIEMARSALRRGDVADSLRALQLHADDFPHGQLREEGESLSVLALVRAGRLAEARSRARTFHEEYPQSLLLPIVDGAVR